MVRTSIRVLIFSSAFVFASGCLTPQSDAVTGLIAATTTTTTASDPTDTGDIYLKVQTSWETDADTVLTTHGTCTIPSGSGLTTQTCTIHIPEGQLHFSKVKFTYGTSTAGLCQRVVFYPSFYVASISAGFTNYWSNTPSAVDCSVLSGGMPKDHGCYWGAAPRLYTDFPKTGGSYILLNSGTGSGSQTLGSMNLSGEDALFPNNLGVCNVKDDPTTGVTMGAQDVYIASTLTPYYVACKDKYEQTLRLISVYIADDDLSTGQDPGVPANDQYYDWNETL